MTTRTDGIDETKFEFPECWKNDVRMGALFAPFRSKNLNPNDWSSKMNFWTSLIHAWCQHKNRPFVHSSLLKKEFSRKGVEPACLDEVLDNMYSTGITVLKGDFLESDNGWKDWAVKRLVTKPLKWTLTAVRNVIMGKNSSQDTEYVDLIALKNMGDTLLKGTPQEFEGKVITFEDLMDLWKVKDSECLLFALVWLERQGRVGIDKGNNYTLVKLPGKKGNKPVVISEVDVGICNLEKQQKALEMNIERLEREKLTALEETKKHLSTNMKNLAKISLRKKKEFEKTIEKRMNTLENVRALLHRIDEIKLEGNVVDCYRTGIAALKVAFDESGLDEVNVATTMDELEDVLRLGTDVSESLARPLDDSVDQSLEEELNELLLSELPAVPNGQLDAPAPAPAPNVEKTKSSKTSREDSKLRELNGKMEELRI